MVTAGIPSQPNDNNVGRAPASPLDQTSVLNRAEATDKAHTDNGAGGQDTKQHALLDTAEAADYLRLSRSCLAKWRCAGGGPEYILAGRKVLYSRTVLDAWLASRSRRNTSART